ncbi:MAG: rhomboid family intramembrane serine protease [Xenococcaceae cyanobacterium MO_188.B32]|nr:rhomboid family intramembrane serine protease [Xenococcaceae cyanobacterium MO_188.B32]
MNKIKPQKIYATYTLIILNLFLFALEINAGGSKNLYTLDYLGALIPLKVLSGQWWRVISANFLHYGPLHLSTNMLALYYLGKLIEINLGMVRYLFIYLFSGIGAMLSFTIFSLFNGNNDAFLVGASAAIMGLVGTLLAISGYIWLKKKTPMNARRLRLVIIVIIVQFVFDNLIPQVSFHSHLFGLIFGFILGIIILFFKFNFSVSDRL